MVVSLALLWLNDQLICSSEKLLVWIKQKETAWAEVFKEWKGLAIEVLSKAKSKYVLGHLDSQLSSLVLMEKLKLIEVVFLIRDLKRQDRKSLEQ
jgi:hypothetical protein